MKIHVGYEMIYDFPQPTPMIMVLGTHFTRASDVIVPDFLTTTPSVSISPYRDVYGNWCSRIVAPAGRMRLSADGVVRDSGLQDVVAPSAPQHAVGDLPSEIGLRRQPLLRDRPASEAAWKLSYGDSSGLGAVQAICDWVRHHITFGYEHARATGRRARSRRRQGRCRDYAHLRRVLPPFEHSGALQRLPRRHRRRPMDRWISPPGSRPISADAGTRSIPAQHPRIGSCPDRPGTRRGLRRRITHTFGPTPGQLQGLDSTKPLGRVPIECHRPARAKNGGHDCPPFFTLRIRTRRSGAKGPACCRNYRWRAVAVVVRLRVDRGAK